MSQPISQVNNNQKVRILQESPPSMSIKKLKLEDTEK